MPLVGFWKLYFDVLLPLRFDHIAQCPKSGQDYFVKERKFWKFWRNEDGR